MAFSGSPAAAWRSRRRSSVPRATSRSRDLSFSIHWSKGASSMMNASRRCPAYSDATLLQRFSRHAPDMALEDGDVDPELRRVERDGRGGGQEGRGARPGEGLAQCEQRLAQAGLSLTRRGVRPEEPLDLLAIVRLSRVNREVRQQRLRLPGGQVNRRHTDARLEAAEKRDHEGFGLRRRTAPALAARCQRGGDRASSGCAASVPPSGASSAPPSSRFRPRPAPHVAENDLPNEARRGGPTPSGRRPRSLRSPGCNRRR